MTQPLTPFGPINGEYQGQYPQNAIPLPSLQVPAVGAASGDVVALVGSSFGLAAGGAGGAYVAGTSGDWATSPPTTIKAALDRMAALLYTLNSNTPIP